MIQYNRKMLNSYDDVVIIYQSMRQFVYITNITNSLDEKVGGTEEIPS
jgi:hypothetical protein